MPPKYKTISKRSILIVEDDAGLAVTYGKNLEKAGFQVVLAPDEESAIRALKQAKPDLVLLDIRLTHEMDDRGGIHVLGFLRDRWSKDQLPVILISEVLDTGLLQELMNKGADTYEKIPISNFGEFLDKIRRYLNRSDTPRTLPLKQTRCWVGKSKAIMKVTESILLAAKAQCDLLILGEVGSGKNEAALFYCNQCNPDKFRTIDVLNVPAAALDKVIWETLLEKPAKTSNRSKTRIKSKNKKVILFEKISEAPKEIQGKLLSLLDNRTYTHPLTGKILKSNCIILATANSDLPDLVKQGKFREDLYYLLQANSITVPPLHERLEDIPLLVEWFLDKHRNLNRKTVNKVDPDVLEKLGKLFWRGNVRQLENCIKHGLLRCPDNIMTWKDVENFIAIVPSGHDETKKNVAADDLKTVFSYRNLTVYTLKRQAYIDEKKLNLGRLEYELLLCLMGNTGEVITWKQFNVYLKYDVANNTITKHINNLRKSLGEYDYYVESVRGIGYRLG